MRYYDKKVAILTNCRNLMVFGGDTSFIYSALEYFDKANIWVDIVIDRFSKTKVKYTDPQFLKAVTPHLRYFHNSVDMVNSGMMSGWHQPVDDALVVNNFFHLLNSNRYDMIIFNTPSVAFAAMCYGFRHPNLYLYLHWHELFLEQKIAHVVPVWMRQAYRAIVSSLPGVKVLTQCEENIPRINAHMNGLDVKVMPIGYRDFTPDYTGERSGIAFIGSGEALKNVELFIDILDGSEYRADFYVGRGITRLEKLLSNTHFDYQLHKKYTRSVMIDYLKRNKVGIYTAHQEGYGLCIPEMMHYMPVLIRSDVSYAEHFPTAIKFNNVTEAKDTIQQLHADQDLWNNLCERNKEWLSQFSTERLSSLYASFADAPMKETMTAGKVRKMVAGSPPTSYSHILKRLGWVDFVAAAAFNFWSGVTFVHTSEESYVRA